MFTKLFLLFAILPIVEIALLINVGEVFGGWNTVALVIITAFIGAHLVRQQGMHTLATAQQKMHQGEMPGQEMAEGLLLLVAGVLLVTPGFITDGIGFLLSMPLTRPLIAKHLMQSFGHKIVMQQSAHAQWSQHQDPFQDRTSQQSSSQQTEFHQQPPKNQDRNTIEGEYERKDD